MNRFFITIVLLFPIAIGAVFNPMSGDQVWALAAESGRIASAIEGTQTRIQSSDIGTTGYVISSPGRYALVENVTYAAAGGEGAIFIQADDVYLDLNGFTITGAGGTVKPLIHLDAGHTNIYIGNGTLDSSQDCGVLIGSNTFNVVIDRINVHQASTQGIEMSGALGEPVENLLITNCNISDCQTSHGLVASHVQCGRIVNSVSYDNAAAGANGIMVSFSDNLSIENCKITNNPFTGIHLEEVTNISIQDCFISNNARGIRTASGGGFAAGNITISSCDIFEHSSNAIELVATTSQITITDVQMANVFQGVSADAVQRIVLDDVQIADVRGGQGFAALNFGANSTDIHVSNVQVIDSLGSGVIFGDGAENIGLDAVSVQSATRDGFEFSGSAMSICLNDCLALESGEHGFLFTGTVTSAVIEHCVSNANSQSGFTFAEGEGIIINNCKAILNGTLGFSVAPGGEGDASHILIDGCQAIRNESSGFRIGAGIPGEEGYSVQSSIIRNCIAESNGRRGFELGMHASLIEGNAATSNVNSNMVLFQPSLSSEALIGHNFVIDCTCNREEGVTSMDMVNFAVIKLNGIRDPEQPNLFAGNAAFVANAVVGDVRNNCYFTNPNTAINRTGIWDTTTSDVIDNQQRWFNAQGTI